MFQDLILLSKHFLFALYQTLKNKNTLKKHVFHSGCVLESGLFDIHCTRSIVVEFVVVVKRSRHIIMKLASRFELHLTIGKQANAGPSCLVDTMRETVQWFLLKVRKYFSVLLWRRLSQHGVMHSNGSFSSCVCALGDFFLCSMQIGF